MRRSLARTAVILGALLLPITACEGGRSEVAHVIVVGGDPERGTAVIQDVGCGACHTIPGIDDADGAVGPPLHFWARRSYIAGAVPNTPGNLVRWIMNAHSIEPGTAMPNLNVTEQQARDVAAYLYTLN